MKHQESWGRLPATDTVQTLVHRPLWKSDICLQGNGSFLPFGQGRSYGDVGLNDGEAVIYTSGLNRFIHFDERSGELTAEAGVTLDQILQFSVPRGFFLPVSPGTKFVSLGGAIANDIHGKNHHIAGTFGRFVTRLSLLRSNGDIIECDDHNSHTGLFSATIAGLGLTGMILDATIQLHPITTAFIDQRTIKFDNLEEFFSISSGITGQRSTYTVAWIDCLAKDKVLGRGHFIAGEHSQHGSRQVHTPPKISCPFDFPSWTLNRYSIGLFNALYYHRQRKKIDERIVHYDPFFYPLDALDKWNRIYGKNGFVQFQCVIPVSEKVLGIKEILKQVGQLRNSPPSFLAVLKEFGAIESPGLLSFPQEGITVCLDFSFRGEETVRLMHRLEDVTMAAGGKIYPAKDAVMRKNSFHKMYSNLEKFVPFIDPKFSSSFVRRVL